MEDLRGGESLAMLFLLCLLTPMHRAISHGASQLANSAPSSGMPVRGWRIMCVVGACVTRRCARRWSWMVSFPLSCRSSDAGMMPRTSSCPTSSRQPVVPPPQPATRGKQAANKGKVVPRWVGRLRAHKVMRVESPPPAVVEEEAPVTGPSGVGRASLFVGTPVPAESGAHAVSGASVSTSR